MSQISDKRMSLGGTVSTEGLSTQIISIEYDSVSSERRRLNIPRTYFP